MLVVAIRKVVLAGLVSLGVSAGGLMLTSASALASKPEAPTLSVGSVSASGATFFGTVNPGAAEPRESGTYQFVYRPTAAGECKGAGETAAPSTPSVTAGIEREEVFPEAIGGLLPSTVYAACLVVTEPGKSEPVASAAVSFKTRASLEQPETDSPVSVSSGEATLEGILNPHTPGEEGEFYNFVYQAESSECRGATEVSVPLSPLPATAVEAQHVSALATGLLPRTTYTYCMLVTTEFGEAAQGEPVTFSTLAGVPAISTPSASDLRSTEGTLNATVNPGGASTTVEIYGAGITVPSKILPGSKTPVPVQQRLSGLTPGTTYVVHIVAVNEAGREEADVTFTTPGVPAREDVGENCPNKGAIGFSLRLPDCRAAEIVSPAGEVGEVYIPGGEVPGAHEEDIGTGRPFRAAADGSGVTYVGDPGLTGGDGSTAKGHGNQYLASRRSGRWSAVNITPPVGEGENPTNQREYKYLSPDLSTGIVAAGEAPLLAAAPDPQGPANCSVLYGVDPTVEPAAYSSLFTETLSPAFCGSTGKGEKIGTDSNLLFAGETPNHAIKLFDSAAALVSPAMQSAGKGGNIYASTQGAVLKVINVLPGGAVEPAAVAGAPSELPANGPDLSNVISPEGNRVIWSAVTTHETLRGRTAAFPAALYAREDPLSASASTTQLDKAAAGAPGASGEGQYWTSAADASQVFFTDCHRLTTDSTAHEEEGCDRLSSSETPVKTGNDLYMYNFARPAGEALIDLTVDHSGGDPLGANVQGVIGASEDGTIVYFVAGGTLGAGPNSRGEAPTAGKCETPPGGSQAELEGHVPVGFGCNLFELQFDGNEWKAPKFIGTLAAVDDVISESSLNDPEKGSSEVSGDWNPRLGSRTAEVTPDGRSLVFSSTQDLTGYDLSSAGASRDTNEQGANEIFLFNSATANLTCVSCDPQNRPADVEVMAKNFETYVPVSSSDTFMHRWVNASGTEVFFDSSEPLVERDLNATQDVYEWAAAGNPSCPTSTSTFGGCIFLLTSGESEAFSFLADIDETGSNVFVVHRGPLYGVGPEGTKSELYDLRASGGQPPRVAEGCISATGCAVEAAPLVAALSPSTMTVTAGGNSLPSVTKRAVVVKKCKKGFTKKRGKCVRSRAKKKVKPKKANRERRGK